MRLVGQHSISRLVLVMIMVVIIGIIIAWNYYASANRSVDPRIMHARELYATYDSHARSGDYYVLSELLDSIEKIYRNVVHYSNSFELGVLENNRAAALLTVALYGDSIPATSNPWSGLPADSLLELAGTHVRQAITIYENWNARFGNKSQPQIRELIESRFLQGFKEVDQDMKEKYLVRRLKEIEKAVQENPRRLSVCYANLGLVYRHQGALMEAVRSYEEAISLWDRNLDAENNLNKLLNKPLKKRNFIQKMFPPERGSK